MCQFQPSAQRVDADAWSKRVPAACPPPTPQQKSTSPHHFRSAISLQPTSTGMSTTVSPRRCWRQIIALLLLCLFSQRALGYSSYLSQSPNGNSVGGGLGHNNAGGGGTRNAYGSAFAAAGRQWTRTLCLAGACSQSHSPHICSSFRIPAALQLSIMRAGRGNRASHCAFRQRRRRAEQRL